ncbi:MAG: LptF/LptG family permease [Inquilinus sp.]|nr:LptF/LptG family permease [Inquilinus sp.]
MDRISLYIFRHLVVATVMATAILTFAIWLTQSLRLIEIIVDGSAPFYIFLRMVADTLPNFLSFVMPIGLVCAVLFTYNRMLSDTEMVVMRAVGISPLGLARPALALALVVAGIGYAMNLLVLPLANQDYRKLQELVESEYATVFLRAGQFNEVATGVTVYFRERTRNGELDGILIHDNRQPDDPVTMIADRGVVAQTEAGTRVMMFGGNRQQLDRETGRLTTLYFEQYALNLQILEPELGPPWQRAKERFIGGLLFPDLDNPRDVAEYARLKSVGHQLLSTPLLAFCFVAVALGALLSGDYNRRGQGKRLASALIVVVLVQAGFFAATSLTRSSVAFTALLYALPVVVFLAGLAAMYLRPPRRPRRQPAAT